jgi:hypothetical protein
MATASALLSCANPTGFLPFGSQRTASILASQTFSIEKNTNFNNYAKTFNFLDG